MWLAAFALVGLASANGACRDSTTTPPAPAESAKAPAVEADTPLPPPAYEAAVSESVRSLLATPFTGDVDQMVARRLIRVGVTYNRTYYLADQGVQRDVAYEYARAFEDWVNKKLEPGHARANVAVLPMPRDMRGAALIGGKVDLMAAQGFQESQINQDAKSHVGAIGVMQLMPATGNEMKVGDITQTDANIHAGVKYMRFMIARYYKDVPPDRLNKGLVALASVTPGVR